MNRNSIAKLTRIVIPAAAFALIAGQAAFAGQWLKGDHHMHTLASDGSDTVTFDVQVSRAMGLDFIAITNHGGSPQGASNYSKVLGKDMPNYIARYTIDYPEILEARAENPDILIFHGFEWNLPGGEHTTVMTMPSPTEALQILHMEAAYDNNPLITTKAQGAEAIKAMLKFKPQPIIINNHPSRSNRVNTDDMKAFAAAGMLGFEGAPGHQAATKGRGGYGNSKPTMSEEEKNILQTWDGYDYMAAKIGGTWDTILNEGTKFVLTCNSDYHSYYLRGASDTLPGEFSKTYVYADNKSYEAVAAGLRSGNVWVTMGDLITGLDFSLVSGGKSAVIGETLETKAGTSVDVKVSFKLGKLKVDHVDVIGNTSGKIEKLAEIKNFEVKGDMASFTMKVDPKKGTSYIRLRGANVAGDPTRDETGDAWDTAVWFYSNPIFIKAQ